MSNTSKADTSKADTSNKQMQSQTKKPFCKVCFDAGKTIAEYSTHYVRDRPGGVVVCPTMLKQQCKYCKKNGHTPKHCPELEGKHEPAKHEQPAKPRHEQPVKHEPKGKPTSLLPVPIIENKNNFKSLALNDGFPVVGEKDSGKIIRPAPVKLNAWASVVTKGPQKKAQAEQPQAEQPQAEQPQAEQPQAEQPQAEQPEEAQAKQQQAQQPEEAQKQPEEAQAPAEQKQPEEAQEEQPEEAQAPAVEQSEEYIPKDYSKCSWADY